MEKDITTKIKSLTELADYYKEQYERTLKEVEKLKKQAGSIQKYYELKAQYPDTILLFRCGDFYETYCEDAITASQVLGITLTRQNNANGFYMAGFPHYALDTYLPKLIKGDNRIAICDQKDL